MVCLRSKGGKFEILQEREGRTGGNIILISLSMKLHRCCDTQRNDILPNDSQPNDIQPNESQPNDIQHNDIQPNDSQPNDSQPNDSQPNDSQPNDIQPNDIQLSDTLHMGVDCDSHYKQHSVMAFSLVILII